MALMNCPECGKEISDKAEMCPNCGYALKTVVEENKQKKSSKLKVVIGIALLVLVLAIACAAFVFIKRTKDEPIKGAWVFNSSIVVKDGEEQFTTAEDASKVMDELPTLYVDNQQAVFSLMSNEFIGEVRDKYEKNGDFYYPCLKDDVTVFTLIMSPNNNDFCTLILNTGTDDNMSNLFMFDRNINGDN